MTDPFGDPVRPRTLWAALLMGPLIGTTYFMVVYLAAEAACGEIEGFGTTALRIVLYAATAAAAGTLVVAGVLTRRVDAEALDPEERVTRRFLGSTGLTLVGMFLFFVLLVGAPVIGSSLC